VLPASGGQATSALDELLAPLTKALDSGASSLSNMVLVPLAKAAEKLVDVIVNVQGTATACSPSGPCGSI